MAAMPVMAHHRCSMSARDYEIFPLGDLPLEGGVVLRDARLAYACYGTLNARRDNCIVFPTYYTGTHRSNARLVGAGRALDPARYFIVMPNLFGNGLSSSPSNAAPAQAGSEFPHTTIYDNVMAQHRLIVDHLGVHRVALATGWSMGALQAYQWAIAFPELVAALLPFCGASRCWPQNFVFLEGVRAALCADQSYQGGRYRRPPVAGLRAFGRAYAGWAYSAAFYRDQLYRSLGFGTLEDFLLGWEQDHLGWDANDLLHKLWTWQHAEPHAGPGPSGTLAGTLGAIRARTIVMPCTTDLYFTLEENRLEAQLIPGAELRPFDSAYGHCAGAPGRFPLETAFLEQAMRELLAP
jgi:homoserine O-acetyltransferase